ncbi:alpha/beta hydrolase fold domain-containing protein [Streptomyces sp. NPDC007896]|uniref:alpha/beta hydrolase fold domain-containing protein n=1 Tax=Streptomyces TaxID=1883 RepID=UPI0036E672C3
MTTTTTPVGRPCSATRSAAPACPLTPPPLAEDLSGLRPAYIEVGELDIFRDEDAVYARRLAATGTSVELHIHPGCPHAFDHLAPQIDVVQRARADRIRVLTSF